MLSIDEALKLIAEQARPLKARRISLRDAAGLVLAEDVRSEINSPPYDKALMDGYAVRSADHEPERRILEEIAAGAVPHLPLTPGTASRIMTGAPLPDGADSVVQVEQTELVDESTVRLHPANSVEGQNVLSLGVSLRVGDEVLRHGTTLRAIEIGALAEIGHGIVTAIPRPRVAILPTGNELVPVGEKPLSGQIRNSNGPMLQAATNHAGADAVELSIARDTHDDHHRWIKKGLESDVLVLSGGVSAGKFDLVPSVLAELGVEQVFYKINLRPGKPLWFGVKDFSDHRTLVFALPGNPVSSLVCFELFVRPAIAALAGRGFLTSPRIEARLSHAYDYKGGRASCLPARIEPPGEISGDADQMSNVVVEILNWQGSADLAALTKANALACLGTQAERLEPGARIEVIPL